MKQSGFRREWRDSCKGNHSDWTYMLWDREAALIFLKTHYPWFLDTFKSYPKTVLQGGLLRLVVKSCKVLERRAHRI